MADIIGKALIIMTNNCNLKLDGKIIFNKENDIEGFVPQITVKEQELEINETHIKNNSNRDIVIYYNNIHNDSYKT